MDTYYAYLQNIGPRTKYGPDENVRVHTAIGAQNTDTASFFRHYYLVVHKAYLR